MKRFVCSLSIIFLISLVQNGDAGLKYNRPKATFPKSPGAFAKGGSSGHDGSFEEVQWKGDLTRWVQTLRGIPVYGSVMTTRSNRLGKIDTVEGFSGEPFSFVDPTPTIPGPNATEIMREHWNHSGPVRIDWRFDEPKLYILQHENDFDDLIWKVSYYVPSTAAQPGFGPAPAFITGLVNAHTGEVKKSWNNLQTAKVKAITGNDKIGESFLDIDVKREGKWCWHKDDERRIRVLNMQNKNFLAFGSKSGFACHNADDQDWDSVNGAYSPRNAAYIHASYFVDLWKNLIGSQIDPYQFNDSSLDLYTHYGFEHENAQFNGFYFLFGDGKDQTYPLTTLDIVCHEIGHAITTWKGAKLEYVHESGAMNEAYSDILGETCDMYYRKKSNYLVGDDVAKPGFGGALRDMCSPEKLDGLNHYKQYNDDVDVHYSSGIYNRAWCELSKTSEWGFIKAFQVFTDANLMFWKEDSTMHCGACGVESAAKNRHLSKSDVTKVFATVGVFCSLCK